MRFVRQGLITCIAAIVLVSSAGRLVAFQEEETVAKEAAAPPAAIDKGDNAWMLVSSALVLMMTAPGLALFYSGLVRKKNVLGVMMQCLFLMGLMSVIWALYGYSLSFGGSPKDKPEDSAWIGTGEYLFMQNVQPELVGSEVVYPTEGTLPRLTHMLFQGMFFIITPGLICGAFAERMKFSTMVVFSILWGTLVYCPLCHWVWDNGILTFGSPRAVFGGMNTGALDFAGGTVVHISSGASALICCLVMGKRLGYLQDPMPPHNLTYTVIGATMLWVGWFGFNAGSALNAGGLASTAFTATHFAAAAGTLTWPLMEWITHGKPTVLGACSGAVAGLVCITPASGFVQPMPALLMGAVAGVVCYLSVAKMKPKFGYDDSLDAFGVHGVGGTLGAVLTGVFATKQATDYAISGGNSLGILEGGSLLVPQIIAAGITWGYAVVVTFVLLKVLDLSMGLRVSQQEEVQGLDYSQHGEEGYIFL
ncbi:MAG TPA: ammonium transporter [Pirellulales bacterium]|nr:ammonium transporter [Pirellulales bacterium]